MCVCVCVCVLNIVGTRVNISCKNQTYSTAFNYFIAKRNVYMGWAWHTLKLKFKFKETLTSTCRRELLHFKCI